MFIEHRDGTLPPSVTRAILLPTLLSEDIFSMAAPWPHPFVSNNVRLEGGSLRGPRTGLAISL
jgi:hypothetical protein